VFLGFPECALFLTERGNASAYPMRYVLVCNNAAVLV